jgi:hypothetical protein
MLINRRTYTVQPVPTPASQSTEPINKSNEGGNNQKLTLFILGVH